MAKPSKEKEGYTLVLCVDRDDDLGVKAGIKTPVLGRKGNLNAAIDLALNDPEDPDSNALFEAIRLYDRLSTGIKTHEKLQVATITGSELGGLNADKKLVSQLTDVLEAFPASDVILVSDGYSDEAVLPLVQSRVRVTSVRRIIVQHSESIEETAALFSRYLKTLVETPRYSRVVIGLPGVLMILLCALWLLNLLFYAWIAFLIVFGSYLFIKGFHVDEKAIGFYVWIREFSPPPLSRQLSIFSVVTGVLLIGIGSYQAGAFVVQFYQPPPNLGQLLLLLPRILGDFVSHSITLMVIGVCVILTGRTIRWFLERDSRFFRTLVVIVIIAWSQQIFYRASQILVEPTLASALQWELVIATITGILISVSTFAITFLLHRKYAPYFGEKAEEIEEFKED